MHTSALIRLHDEAQIQDWVVELTAADITFPPNKVDGSLTIADWATWAARFYERTGDSEALAALYADLESPAKEGIGLVLAHVVAEAVRLADEAEEPA